MKRVCGGTPGWPCGKTLDPPEKEPFEDSSISHGLCEECRRILMDEFLAAYPALLRDLAEKEAAKA